MPDVKPEDVIREALAWLVRELGRPDLAIDVGNDAEAALAQLTEELRQVRTESAARYSEGVRVGIAERDTLRAQVAQLTEERDEAVAHAWDLESGEAYYRMQRQIADLKAALAASMGGTQAFADWADDLRRRDGDDDHI